MAGAQARIDAFVEYRNGLLAGPGGAAASSRPSALGLAADETATMAETQLPQLRSLMAELGEHYTGFSSQTTMERWSRAGSTAVTVRYSEFTTIFYDRVRMGLDDEAEDTSYRADYEARFRRSWTAGGWVLESVTLLAPETAIAPMTQPIEGRRISASVEEFYGRLAEHDRAVAALGLGAADAPDSLARPTDEDVMTAVDFQIDDVAGADAYGDRHVFNYNSDFKAYNNDCTNFVSQIMDAGGWNEKTGWYRSNNAWWYNHNPTNRLENNSWTWSGANNFFHFARGHRTESRGNVWNMQKGDAVNLDFEKDGHKDHTMFVEARTSDGTPYLTYHTTDTNYRSLPNMLAAADGNWWWYSHRTH